MASPIATMVAVKRAVQDFLKHSEGVLGVQSAIGPRGPEVQVLVQAKHMKRLRLLLPYSKNDIPIVVRVAKESGPNSI